VKDRDLTERFVCGEEVYAGGFLRLRRDVVRLPDGSETVREYVQHPGAVAIVALLDDGRVVLERQHRYPLGRDFVEIPAGKLEPDEAIELWLARGLEKRAAKLDAGEFLEVLALPFEEAVAMIRDGRITDAKTIAGLLWVKAFLQE